jgi:toxin ParE1/3/4
MPNVPSGARRLIWAPAARNDLREIWNYFDRVATAEIADALYSDIIRGTERLCERPLIGRSRSDLHPDLRSIRVHPYSIFYRLRNDTVQIVRILHDRRDIRKAMRETKA